MDVRLVVEKGNTQQQTWHLHHENTVVGRRRDCDLRILSAEVSRRHCLLHIDEGCVNVEDLDSINGTFVNGSRVVGKQALLPGDHLGIGPMEFIVEYELPTGRGRLEEQPSQAASDEHQAYDVEPLVEEKNESDSDWHVPPTSELRDLLSQMEQPEASPRL